MDRMVSRLVVYVAIGLAVAYLWMHSNSIRNEANSLITDWWR